MKKVIFLSFAAFILFSTFCHAQKLSEAKVPAAVKSAQEKKFPGITKVTWSKEENDFESEFTQNGKTMSAIYDPKGNWIETETTINVTTLPQPIVKYIAQHMAGKRIKEAARVDKADGSIAYEAEISNTDYIFDATGKLLKTEKD
jgi:hypothetical protein